MERMPDLAKKKFVKFPDCEAAPNTPKCVPGRQAKEGSISHLTFR